MEGSQDAAGRTTALMPFSAEKASRSSLTSSGSKPVASKEEVWVASLTELARNAIGGVEQQRHLMTWQ